MLVLYRDPAQTGRENISWLLTGRLCRLLICRLRQFPNLPPDSCFRGYATCVPLSPVMLYRSTGFTPPLRGLFSGRPLRAYVAFAPLLLASRDWKFSTGLTAPLRGLFFPCLPAGSLHLARPKTKSFFCLPNALPVGINSAVSRSADKMPFRQFGRANCGGKGIRTLDTLLRYTHFPGVLLRPLGHSSKIKTNVKKTKPDFDYQPFAPHFQLTGERLANSQEPLLRVKVRINICCVQHQCEFRRFYNPFAHKDHSVISPRIGVCR